MRTPTLKMPLLKTLKQGQMIHAGSSFLLPDIQRTPASAFPGELGRHAELPGPQDLGPIRNNRPETPLPGGDASLLKHFLELLIPGATQGPVVVPISPAPQFEECGIVRPFPFQPNTARPGRFPGPVRCRDPDLSRGKVDAHRSSRPPIPPGNFDRYRPRLQSSGTSHCEPQPVEGPDHQQSRQFQAS